MVCVTDRMLGEPGLLDSFAAWRDGSQRAFLKLVDVTGEGTYLWARKIVRTPNRILFVIKIAGRPIGHIGYAEVGSGFEVCDVLRGECAPRSTMDEALNTLICWLRKKALRTFGCVLLRTKPAPSDCITAPVLSRSVWCHWNGGRETTRWFGWRPTIGRRSGIDS